LFIVMVCLAVGAEPAAGHCFAAAGGYLFAALGAIGAGGCVVSGITQLELKIQGKCLEVFVDAL
jgi:hypothetical protein